MTADGALGTAAGGALRRLAAHLGLAGGGAAGPAGLRVGGPAALEAPGVAVTAEALRGLRGLLREAGGRGPRGAAAQAGPVVGRRRGRGMEPLDLRPFADGDDPRHLDRHASARAGRPILRDFHEERALATLLIADFRPGMLWGTRRRLRSVAAAEALALAGWRRVAQGGRVGLLTLGAAGPTVVRLRPGPRGMEAVIGGLVAAHARALADLRAAGPRGVRPAPLPASRPAGTEPSGAAARRASAVDATGGGLRGGTGGGTGGATGSGPGAGPGGGLRSGMGAGSGDAKSGGPGAGPGGGLRSGMGAGSGGAASGGPGGGPEAGLSPGLGAGGTAAHASGRAAGVNGAGDRAAHPTDGQTGGDDAPLEDALAAAAAMAPVGAEVLIASAFEAAGPAAAEALAALSRRGRLLALLVEDAFETAPPPGLYPVARPDGGAFWARFNGPAAPAADPRRTLLTRAGAEVAVLAAAGDAAATLALLEALDARR